LFGDAFCGHGLPARATTWKHVWRARALRAEYRPQLPGPEAFAGGLKPKRRSRERTRTAQQRAERHAGEQLGLEPVGAKASGKFVYRCGGTELALFPKAGGTKATHSTLSFQVKDITAAIRALEARGVVFADYDLPGFKTVDHVAVLGSEKAAWFQDPEGNTLCIHEDIA